MVTSTGVCVVVFEHNIIIRLAFGKAGNKRGHAHFDVELRHVRNSLKLNIDELVRQRHEADHHDIDSNRKYHQLGVECY